MEIQSNLLSSFPPRVDVNVPLLIAQIHHFAGFQPVHGVVVAGNPATLLQMFLNLVPDRLQLAAHEERDEHRGLIEISFTNITNRKLHQILDSGCQRVFIRLLFIYDQPPFLL